MKLPAGDLDRRVEIQAKATTKNAIGETATTYTVAGYRWAEIKDRDGRESSFAEQTKATKGITVKIRRFDGITTEHRIRETSSGRVLAIVAVQLSDERSKGHILNCVEAPS